MPSPASRQPFRYAAPAVLGHDALLRPRLVSTLAGRFGRRLTTVMAGPGFGKTTLLAQAFDQNLLDPRGVDVWLGLTAADGAPGHLVGGLLGALGVEGAEAPDLDDVVAGVWRRAPSEVCIVLDDLHLVPEGSAGRALVGQLVDALPVNGHLLVATRPPADDLVGLADTVVGEDALAFDEDELQAFADHRSVTTAAVASSGGWPALAALCADAGQEVADAYLGEEVLAGLDPDRRAAVERLVAFPAFDDEIAAAVAGQDVGAVDLVEGLPLVEVDEGTARFHDLWRRAVAVPGGGDKAIRRGTAVLQARGRYREAFDALARAGDDDAVAALIDRLAALDLPELHVDDFAYVLGRLPGSVDAGPATDLLRGHMLLGVDGAGARAALGASADGYAARGDADGEFRALAHKLWLHSWDADVGAMGEVLARLEGLSSAGNVRARRTVAVTSAYLAQVSNDPDRVIEIVEGEGLLDDPATVALAGYLLSVALVEQGEPAAARTVALRAAPVAQGRLRVGVVGTAFEALLIEGLPGDDEIRVLLDELLELSERYGVAEPRAQVLAGAAQVCAEYGWLDEGWGHLAAAQRLVEVVGARVRPAATMAETTLLLVDGDEPAAVEALRRGLALDPFGRRPPRPYLRSLATVYVLAPEVREAIEAFEVRGAWRYNLALGRALVAARAGDLGPAADLDWSDPDHLRSAAPAPFVAELALAAQAGGRPEAAVVLDELPVELRPLLDALGGHPSPEVVAAASACRAALPDLPSGRVALGVFGTTELRRDGELVGDGPWRRDRVRAIAHLLVEHGRIDRRRVSAMLWPDLEPAAALDNLRVNLAHLQRALEPDREPGDSTFFVRSSGHDVELVRSAWIDLDVDRFEQAVAAGRAAEAEMDLAGAIGHYREAVAIRRGPYLVDTDVDGLGEARRADLDRIAVEAAVRAAELLVATGEPEEAVRLGATAGAIDPFAEEAVRVSAAALRALGDRAGAWRLVSGAVERLRDEGLEPEPGTTRLLEDLVGV